MMTTTSSTSTTNNNRPSPRRLLFICLGNICRSPAAEGIMKKMTEDRHLADKYFIDSAGIGGWHVGELPDKRMRSHAAKRGYNLNSNARQFDETDFERFDHIIVMDEENYKNLSSRAKDTFQRGKILKMKDFFLDNVSQKDVPDPYYGGDKDFEWALDLIEDGCKGLLKHFEKE